MFQSLSGTPIIHLSVRMVQVQSERWGLMTVFADAPDYSFDRVAKVIVQSQNCNWQLISIAASVYPSSWLRAVEFCEISIPHVISEQCKRLATNNIMTKFDNINKTRIAEGFHTIFQKTWHVSPFYSFIKCIWWNLFRVFVPKFINRIIHSD